MTKTRPKERHGATSIMKPYQGQDWIKPRTKIKNFHKYKENDQNLEKNDKIISNSIIINDQNLKKKK